MTTISGFRANIKQIYDNVLQKIITMRRSLELLSNTQVMRDIREATHQMKAIFQDIKEHPLDIGQRWM